MRETVYRVRNLRQQAAEKRWPAMRSFRITGPVWPPPQRQTSTLFFYFQLLNSLIWAIDCRGSMIESHSLHTPTRIFEKVTADLFIRMFLVS